MSALVIGALSAQINAAPSKGTRLTSGTSFTATVTGWHRVVCQGGGGGGASGSQASGGGAGMWCESWHYLTAGTAYAYTIGAGGTAGVGASGGAGGATSFTGPNITATALGGTGGIGLTAGTGGRLDGNTTSSAPAVWQPPNTVGGANGSSSASAGGYCGMRAGGTSATGFGGGASPFAAGGNGGAFNAVGTAGTLGSGGGGSGSASFAGGTGGPGLIEIY